MQKRLVSNLIDFLKKLGIDYYLPALPPHGPQISEIGKSVECPRLPGVQGVSNFSKSGADVCWAAWFGPKDKEC